MSSVATFRLITRDELSAAARASSRDEVDDILRESADGEVTLPWSGSLLLMLLPFLDERGIALLSSTERDAAEALSVRTGALNVVLTEAERDAHLDALTPTQFSDDELRTCAAAFDAADEPGVVSLLRDAIAALRELLGQVDDEYVGLLSIR